MKKALQYFSVSLSLALIFPQTAIAGPLDSSIEVQVTGTNSGVDWTGFGVNNFVINEGLVRDVADENQNPDAFDGFGYIHVTLDSWQTSHELEITDSCYDDFGGSSITFPSSNVLLTDDEFTATCDASPITFDSGETLESQVKISFKGSWVKWEVQASSDTPVSTLQAAIHGNLGSDSDSSYKKSGLPDGTLISHELNDSDPVIGYRGAQDSSFQSTTDFGDSGLFLPYGETVDTLEDVANISSEKSLDGSDAPELVAELELFLLGFESSSVLDCAVELHAVDALDEDFGSNLEFIMDDNADCLDFQPSGLSSGGECAAPTKPSRVAGEHWVIDSAGDLVWLSTQYTQDVLSADFVLARDIDLQSCDFNPIGRDLANDFAHEFSGVFDGQGYQISNLWVEQDGTVETEGFEQGDYSYLGLFAVIHNGEVKNLRLQGFVSDDGEGSDSVGLLAGAMYGGSLTNIELSGTVVAYDYVGGLTGYIDDGEVSQIEARAISVSGRDQVGGLIGDFEGVGHLLDTLVLEGYVSGEDELGGVAGEIDGDIQISHARFSGLIAGDFGDSDYVGGIVGWMDNDSIAEYLYSSGVLIGYYESGGIAGHLEGPGTMSKAHSDMTIVVQDNENGGIVGHLVGSDSQVEQAYFTGRLISTGDEVGGIVGNNDDGTVLNSYSTGVISGYDEVGGIVGDSSSGMVINSYAAGTYFDFDESSSGGVTGNSGTETNSYSLDTAGIELGDGLSVDRTLAEMQTRSTFSGWDFDNVWAFDDDVNDGLPYLEWSRAAIPTTAVNFVWRSTEYFGPIIHSAVISENNIEVALSGTQLDSITSVTIASHELSMVNVSDSNLVMALPVQLEPGKYDVNIVSDYGLLRALNLLTVSSNQSIEDGDMSSWTKRISPEAVKVYAKNVVSAGKVQIIVNGEEIAWVNALSLDDPKLRIANEANYLVRTVDLVAGQKNVIEVYHNGVRVKRAAYSN